MNGLAFDGAGFVAQELAKHAAYMAELEVRLGRGRAPNDAEITELDRMTKGLRTKAHADGAALDRLAPQVLRAGLKSLSEVSDVQARLKSVLATLDAQDERGCELRSACVTARSETKYAREARIRRQLMPLLPAINRRKSILSLIDRLMDNGEPVTKANVKAAGLAFDGVVIAERKFVPDLDPDTRARAAGMVAELDRLETSLVNRLHARRT